MMQPPLLLLDLDETLIYGSTCELARGHDFVCGEYFIYKRPHVDEFISKCASAYSLAVWTSSTSDYAACVVPRLFGEVAVAFVWARDRCTNRYDLETRERYWVKDLKKVKRAGYDLARVLIVDDTAQKIERNYGNVVIVREYCGDPEDRELCQLSDYLVSLVGVANFREVDKRNWRLAR